MDIGAVLARPGVREWIEKQGGVAGGGTPQAPGAFQAAETRKWREVVRSAGIEAE